MSVNLGVMYLIITRAKRNKLLRSFWSRCAYIVAAGFVIGAMLFFLENSRASGLRPQSIAAKEFFEELISKINAKNANSIDVSSVTLKSLASCEPPIRSALFQDVLYHKDDIVKLFSERGELLFSGIEWACFEHKTNVGDLFWIRDWLAIRGITRLEDRPIEWILSKSVRGMNPELCLRIFVSIALDESAPGRASSKKVLARSVGDLVGKASIGDGLTNLDVSIVERFLDDNGPDLIFSGDYLDRCVDSDIVANENNIVGRFVINKKE